MTISANPLSITVGQTTTVTWSASNAIFCVTNFYTTNADTSGTDTFAPTQTTTYSVVAVGVDKKTTDTAFVTVTVTPQTIGLGNFYQGGIIFWLDNTSQHGLIAAVYDQSDSTKGLSFTQAIQACANYGSGYRLPDSTELKLLKNAKKAGFVKNFVGPVFDPVGLYISSTEMTGNSNWEFCIPFNNDGYPEGWINKNNPSNVRAVKSF